MGPDGGDDGTGDGTGDDRPGLARPAAPTEAGSEEPPASGPPGYGPPAYGPPGYGPPGYGPPGYGPPGYGPPGYGPPGYGPPGYGPPGYGAGPYGYGYGMAPPRNNNLAVASLIMGLLGIATCQLLGIGALITGYKARRQIRETGEQGSGMALAGIILGWASLALFLVVIVIYAAIFIVAITSSGGSGSTTATLYTPPSTVFRSPSTTERVSPSTSAPPVSSGAPGSSVVASGVIPADACPAVTLALHNLEAPEKNDRGIVTDAARTLHQYYPEASADDIDTVLADALSRVNRDTTGGRTTAVLEASQRLDATLAAACPG